MTESKDHMAKAASDLAEDPSALRQQSKVAVALFAVAELAGTPSVSGYVLGCAVGRAVAEGITREGLLRLTGEIYDALDEQRSHLEAAIHANQNPGPTH